MDGKTPGLIIGKNFVIEEGEIVAATFNRKAEPLGKRYIGYSGDEDSVCIYMRCGPGLLIAGEPESAEAIYIRVKALLERRHRMITASCAPPRSTTASVHGGLDVRIKLPPIG